MNNDDKMLDNAYKAIVEYEWKVIQLEKELKNKITFDQVLLYIKENNLTCEQKIKIKALLIN